MKQKQEISLRNALDIITTGDLQLLPQEVHAEARDILENAKSWVAGPNIVGFGISQKTISGHPARDVCLKVYVKRKLPRAHLPGSERVPVKVAIPGLTFDVPTDVEETGELQPELFTGRVRPLVPGCSIGYVRENTGTFGCVVTKRGGQKRPLVLSNCHVLANYGLASPGDGTIQPGPDDGGGPEDQIGGLVDFTQFVFSDGYDNLCDAAVSELTGAVEAASFIPQIGIPTRVRKDIARGLQIQKTGRTTEHTIGVIRDIDFRFFLKYPNPSLNGARGKLGFRSQVLCTRYTDEGDSGSVVCDMDGQLIGLHFVGGPTASVFSPISFVFESLGLDLLGQ